MGNSASIRVLDVLGETVQKVDGVTIGSNGTGVPLDVASITIVNAKGEKVLNDNESIIGAGHHFFYFSAKDLPSGTYYYTIEFPQGVVIASKTMLVVK